MSDKTLPTFSRSERRTFLWIGLAFAILQCGPALTAVEYSPVFGNASDFWLTIPFIFLALLCVWLTWHLAVPRFIPSGKTTPFILALFGMSYIVSLVELLLVEYIWTRWGIIPSGTPIHVGWLLLNAFSNSLMFFFTLLVLGFWRLYRLWTAQLNQEAQVSASLRHYMDEVRDLLHPDQICQWLRDTIAILDTDNFRATRMLNDLSSALRKSLYNLPEPPQVKLDTLPVDTESGLNLFLSAKRYRWARFFLFQLVLFAICFGAFFAAPDRPEFGPRIPGTLSLLFLFEIVAAADYFIVFRRFRKKRNPKGLLWGSVILALVVVLPLLGGRIQAFLVHPYDSWLFILTTSLATLASLIMMSFFIGGFSALLLYGDWLKEHRRTVLLQAANVRLEFAHLRRQINPHFLFNVLNNAGILAYEDPQLAKRMLSRLITLMEYQFTESSRAEVSLEETIDFLQSYLALETTRKDNLDYSFDVVGDVEGIMVPSLMYIPFVENAVKFAAPIDGLRKIAIQFQVCQNELTFLCRNAFGEDVECHGASGREGGLGISNTLRRLQLLYEGRFSYHVDAADGLYSVRLSIPIHPKIH